MPRTDPPEPGTGGLAVAGAWSAQWALVPEAWRRPVYRLDQAPANQVFTRNANYLRSVKDYDFTPTGPDRLGQELAWWVWLCWRDGLRKVEPSMLAWWRRAVESMAAARAGGSRPVRSLAELEPAAVVREAVLLFQRRNDRLPSPGNRRNLQSLTEHLHLLVAARTGTVAWWEQDVWDLRTDPRIPRREHEPHADLPIRLVAVSPLWLREGLRFWLRTALTHQLLTWTTAVSRLRSVGGHLGRFCLEHGHHADPLIADEQEQLRSVFLDFLAHLRSPAAARTGATLVPASVAAVQSHVQSFYSFMHDHAAEAASATGSPRWRVIGAAHTRLWAPAYQPRRRGNVRALTWIATKDLQRMLSYLDVLGAGTSERVTITNPDTGVIEHVAGLGDPQAARAWLLQAMTGRRASEILMLDFDPVTPIPGLVPEPGDSDTFVARLRYQQTKIDGVDPTIPIEQPVLTVIREQQDWLAQHHPGLTPRYLFLGLRHNHRGAQPRPYRSYQDALKRLDQVHGLTDSAGHTLRFTQTHRLRHTRATELLNDGVPLHVVQRYLGHKSPEMTAHYAATLAATAEAEFLKHKKIGADGRAIQISPRDIYDLTQLGKRTDRVLPNGLCLLPPVKTCDKGNACLSCGHFATDATHRDRLTAQREATAQLLTDRRADYHARTGREWADDNIWVAGRLREIASLDAILTRLDGQSEPVAGGGTTTRGPLLQIHTRGAHETLLNQPHRNEHA
ncbi:MAG: tyrosine-type recombinase/integrase [Jatrophihabitantaceae bacterium]